MNKIISTPRLFIEVQATPNKEDVAVARRLVDLFNKHLDDSFICKLSGEAKMNYSILRLRVALLEKQVLLHEVRELNT